MFRKLFTMLAQVITRYVHYNVKVKIKAGNDIKRLKNIKVIFLTYFLMSYEILNMYILHRYVLNDHNPPV